MFQFLPSQFNGKDPHQNQKYSSAPADTRNSLLHDDISKFKLNKESLSSRKELLQAFCKKQVNFLLGRVSSLNLNLSMGWSGKSKPFRREKKYKMKKPNKKKGRKFLAQSCQYFKLQGIHLEY